jgi:crotonobetaine/carnitine-CoA ligase
MAPPDALTDEAAASLRVVDPDTVLDALDRAVAAAPDRIFLDFGGDTYTFAETAERATCFAHELRKRGLGVGETVVTVLDNSIDLIVAWLAINKVGGVWVPLNTAYRFEFLRHQVDDSLARIVIIEDAYLDRVAEISDQLPNLRLVLCRGVAGEGTAQSAVPVEALDECRGTDTTPIESTAGPGDLCMLLYTSGTTGPSKGCMISHNFITNQARQSNRSIPPGPDDVVFTPLPLFHAAAVDTVLSAMLAQVRVAVAARFSVSGFWQEIDRSGATIARLMASILPLVAHTPDNDAMKRCYGQLRAVVGGPFPTPVRKIWHERFGTAFTSAHQYGLTEGVRLSMECIDDAPMPEECVGKIESDSYDVVILDDDDNILEDGQQGEIAFRPRKPYVMFDGYWRRPEATVTAWRNLWMHTGDYGRIENGYLFFVDRKKDYLRSRGENISSFEVERAFLDHPDIVEVAAHAAGGGIAEDQLKVTVVLREGVTLSEYDLCLWALDHVPHFAVPRYIEFRPELPRTPTNKVEKHRLRDQGVTPSTWDREVAGIQVRRQR